MNITNYMNNSANLRTNDSISKRDSNVEIIQQSDVGKLDQNAFLKMMLTQLQHQDPLSPMDTNAFSTQMAQFTTVEQLSNISSKLDEINELIFMSLLQEKPSSDNDSSNTSKEDTTDNTIESSSNDEISNQAKIIKNELENLKSITIKTDFDYTSEETNDFRTKLANLILNSK